MLSRREIPTALSCLPAGQTFQAPPARRQAVAAPASVWGASTESLAREIITFVKQTSRVIAHKDSRAIAGLSMGGGHTMTVAKHHPGVFGDIGVFSARPRQVDPALDGQLEALKARGARLYGTGAGTTDDAREGALYLVALVKQHGSNAGYREDPGARYWFIWRTFLGDFGSQSFRSGRRLNSVGAAGAIGGRECTGI